MFTQYATAGRTLAFLWAAIPSLLLAAPARAQLLWQGHPAMGEAAFKNFNNDGNATITAAMDPERGEVWRYHKVPGSNRSENHGIRVDGQPYSFQEGSTYYFGWWSKLTSTANNNANFQWKSYENHIQNFPVILKMIGGRMTLQYRPPGQNLRTVWSGQISANTWYHYALALHLSKDANQGWIELWFNGQQQMLTNGQTRYNARTYDSGNHNCPKWGIYGAINSNITNWIDDLKVGMSHASVAAGSASSPTPSDGGQPDADPPGKDMAGPGGAPADAGSSTGGAAGQGGAGGSGPTGGGTGGRGGAGRGGTGAAAGTAAGGSGSATQDPGEMAGGCACSMAVSSSPPLASMVPLLAALVLAWRRRRS